ncbi:MAG: MFS transporter [Trueperaceae bacterium]|nr:MFS transporter [Trueperaceae bacterium]
MATPPPPPAAAPGGALTLGLVLGVTVMAFGGLAVVTIAPRIPADLGGLELYGWIFSAYLLASLFGTVWGGNEADRRGPARAFTLGLFAFAGGLVVAAIAPSMAVLIAGRVLQGAGGGAVITCIYVALSLAYPDADRPRVLAYLSSAWVVPALVGPALAGAVAEVATWRWVFAALVPLTVLVAVLTLPTFARLPQRPPGTRSGRDRLLNAGTLALAVGLAIWSIGGSGAWPLRALAFGIAIAAVPRALAALTPPRTLRLGPGLGAVIAARGLFFAAFITVEVFLALMLTDVLALSSAVTGVVIATGAISWSTGAWTQARLDARRGRIATTTATARLLASLAEGRDVRVRLGVAVIAVGLVAQMGALAAGPERAVLALVVAVMGWMVAGLGIGFAHASSSALAFVRAEDEGVPVGTVSSSLLLADNVSAAVATGVGGALLATATGAGAPLGTGVALGYFAGYAAIALSAVASQRIGAPPVQRRPAPRR